MSHRNPEPAEEYVESRRVLLDVLEALGPQRRAVVVAGAQAIYLRAGTGSMPIADFTTDGDLALDPGLLSDEPILGELLKAAGFELAVLQGASEPGVWQAPATIDGVETKIPVDLIVPEGVSPPGGTRGARLGVHGKRAARRADGLEAALVDNDSLVVGALDPADSRSVAVKVAGLPALLVAKTHKIQDRIESGREDRLDDKDASDVIRLMQASAPDEVASTLSTLTSHPTAGTPTEQAIARFHDLFGTRNGTGIEMAARALRLAMPEERVRAICLAYSRRLAENLDV